MKQLQSISLAIAITLLLFSGACKKDSAAGTTGTASGSYYMRFKAAGVQKEYLQNAGGNFNHAQTTVGYYSSTIGGTKDPFDAKKDNMALALVVKGLAQQNITYTNFTTIAAGSQKAYISQAGYYNEAGEFYTSWSEDFNAAIPAGTENNMKITITAVTSTSLKGTFSGVLYNADYSKKIVITDGDYLIKLQ